MDALIVTGTIDPGGVPIALRNPSERLLQYTSSLILWATKGPFESIVFCENSNQGKKLEAIRDIPSLKEKKFDLISFDGNRESLVVGKGYGEGVILERAYSSPLVQAAEHVWKATGRLFIENAYDLEKIHRDTPNVINPLDTRFFKFSKTFFTENLLHAYRKVDERVGSIIEIVYTDAVSPFVEKGVVSRFREPFLIMGQTGGTGRWNRPFPEEVTAQARTWRDKILQFPG